MNLEQQIHDALELTFAPTTLVVTNESHKHAGHAGDDGTGESHWHIEIASDSFDDKTRIAKHRAIHSALGQDIIGRIHALSLQIA